MNISEFHAMVEAISEKLESQRAMFSPESLKHHSVQELNIIPNILEGGKFPLLKLEKRQHGCFTISAYCPMSRQDYLVALSSEGTVRFNLTNLYSSRNAVVTGGLDYIGESTYFYVVIDTPFFTDNPEYLRAVLYRAMETADKYWKKNSEVRSD